MMTLRQVISDICRPTGGHFNIPVYKVPIVSDELLDEVDDWYRIKHPGEIWICRASDVPNGYFSYSKVIPLVRVIRKTADEYWEEENALRNMNA